LVAGHVSAHHARGEPAVRRASDDAVGSRLALWSWDRIHDVSVLSIGARPRAGQQELPDDFRATERGARAENITSSIIERPGSAAAVTGTARPRVVLRRADDDLWVATSNGEYAGLVTQHPDGFHVHDRYTRPIRVVAALDLASRLLAAPRGLDGRRRA
jgi:hypothetical protein